MELVDTGRSVRFRNGVRHSNTYSRSKLAREVPEARIIVGVDAIADALDAASPVRRDVWRMLLKNGCSSMERALSRYVSLWESIERVVHVLPRLSRDAYSLRRARAVLNLL